ncbi:MAG TPA: peptidylprolyl isomerase [Gemmatimonadaceae bacterium]
MKRLLVTALALGTAAPAFAQQADTSVIQLDAIVAVVGNVPITVYDIEQRLADSVRSMRSRNQPMPSADKRKEMVLATLNSLIDEEVLLAKAKEMNIEVPDAEVTTATEQQIKGIAARFPSDAVFRQQLLAAGLGTPDEYRRYMNTQYRRDRTISLLVQKLTAPGENQIPAVTVPESKVLAEYQRYKQAGPLTRLATVLWRQMVIAPAPTIAARTIARAKAESLRAEIRAGGDFERIAKRESMDAATKELGGDLGWRKRGDLPEELERLVFGPFALKPGDVSSVVESPFGFHILRLDRANPPAEVKVRQILIVPKVDSNDVQRASKLADSLVNAIRHGANFDTVAHHFHDLAEDAPGLMSETPFDSLPISYKEGLRGVKKDSVVAFPIPAGNGINKYVIAQVVTTNEAGEYTYDEVKARIRSNLQQVAQMRRYIDTQRKTLYVQKFEDRALAATAVFDRGGSP